MSLAQGGIHHARVKSNRNLSKDAFADVKTDASAAPCAPQLVSLLTCFATHSDLRANAQCAETAKALAACVAGQKTGGGRGAKGSVSCISNLLLMCSPLVLLWGYTPRHCERRRVGQDTDTIDQPPARQAEMMALTRYRICSKETFTWNW